jgi:hypothetical protein
MRVKIVSEGRFQGIQEFWLILSIDGHQVVGFVASDASGRSVFGKERLERRHSRNAILD